MDPESYNESEVQTIQENYRYLFPSISKELESFWYPSANHDWLCLTSRFHPSSSYEKFQALHAELRQKMGGSELAALSKKHGVGYSIGLNPWADYFLSLMGQERCQDVVVIVGYNWYPLVSKRGETPYSPLYKVNPCKKNTWKYIFEPFLNHTPPLLIFFANIFPHFIKAGKSASAGLDTEEKNAVGGKEGMKQGLIWTIQAINPAIRIRGLITLGGPAWRMLASQVDDPFSGMKVKKLTETLRTKLHQVPLEADQILFTFRSGGKDIPWLPYYHPIAFEMFAREGWQERRTDYLALSNTLLDQNYS